MTVSISGTGGLTFNDNSVQDTAATGFGFKNRIMNGAMVLDQRNAGASVTISTSGVYALDRWKNRANGGGAFSVQQSSTAPTGFNTAVVYTVTTADSSIAAGDNYWIIQDIEGFNVADLGWGTANAQTVTISFWVRSSVTGTFNVALSNGTTYDRSFVSTYAVNVANTYEYKTITIAGDASGTWSKTNGGGISLIFNLGAGTSFQATANTWSAGFLQSTSGSTNLIATNGATFYITGVQLEKGSTATSFDYRPFGTELALCQRYFETNYPSGTAVGAGSMQPNSIAQTICSTNGYLTGTILWKATKRASPTVVYFNYNGTINSWFQGKQGQTENAYTPANVNASPYLVYWSNIGINTDSNVHYGMFTASSEL